MLHKFFGHLMTVLTHKYWVAKYCFKMGLYWRGIIHDMSKFSPTEFFEGVKYYQEGVRSPIKACKEINGWSKAWLHHKGRNRHHAEYWTDDFDHGCHPLRIPFKYACEMVADFFGASHAYHRGKEFSYQREYEWWQNKKSKPVVIHPDTAMFLEKVMSELAQSPNPDSVLTKKHLRKLYDESIDPTHPVKY